MITPSERRAINHQAKDLEKLGLQAKRSDDLALARTHLENALALYNSIDDEAGQKGALIFLAKITIQQQEWHTSHDYLHRLLSLAPSVDYHHWVFRQLGLVEGHLNHHEAARHYFALAYDLYVREDISTAQHKTLWEWGQFEYRRGQRSFGLRLCALAVAACQQLCEYTLEYHHVDGADEKPAAIVASYEAQLAQMSSEEPRNL